MGLNNVQEQILGIFSKETLNCIEHTLKLKATLGNGFEEKVENFKFKGFAVAASTMGVISGKILLHLYPEAALALGNRLREIMLGEKQALMEVDDDISEAVQEFANTVTGLCTRALDQADIGIRFRPFYAISNIETMDIILQDIKEILTIPIHLENAGKFYFNYLLYEITEAT